MTAVVPHVVLDASPAPDNRGLGVRVCLRCKARGPMPPPPISIPDFVALGEAFTREHRRCPAPPAGGADAGASP